MQIQLIYRGKECRYTFRSQYILTRADTRSALHMCRSMQKCTWQLMKGYTCRYTPSSQYKPTLWYVEKSNKYMPGSRYVQTHADRAHLSIRADACRYTPSSQSRQKKCRHTVSSQYAQTHADTQPALDTGQHMQIHAYCSSRADTCRYMASFQLVHSMRAQVEAQFPYLLSHRHTRSVYVQTHADTCSALCTCRRIDIHAQFSSTRRRMQIHAQLLIHADKYRYTLKFPYALRHAHKCETCKNQYE
jgi:hypothetical protein